MIPYMDLNEQVDADFTRARRRARLRGAVAGLRPILPAHEDERGAEVEASRPSFPPCRRLAAGRALQARGCLLRGGWPPSSLGGPLPRRADGRSLSSRILSQASRCTGTYEFEELVNSLAS